MEEHEDLATIRGVIESNAVKEDKDKAKKELLSIQKNVMDQFLAYLFIENADRTKYGTLVSGLETQFSLSNDQYPKSLIDTQNVIENHTFDPEYRRRKKNQNQKE